MRISLYNRCLVSVLALLLVPDLFAVEMSLTSADKAPPKELDASIRDVLQPKALQVIKGGKPAYEFWFRENVPLQSRPASADKALDAIKQATLLGVATLPSAKGDYRDDEIPPGVYTMRFALQPQDGNHLGTADYSYFIVLTPIKHDAKLDALTDYKQVVKASSKDTSTGHPMILSLRPPSAEAGDMPKIVEPASDHKSVLLKLQGKSGGEAVPIPLEIVVEGKTHE